MKKCQLVKALVCAVLFVGLVSQVQAVGKKVKVFIFAGQSNMEGHGQVRSLDWLGEHPKYGHLLKKLKNADGSWAVRDDVTISYQAEHRKKRHGLLTVGWGSEEHEIGPELMFGTIMGDKYDEPVLLIKTAWGGKDVYCDFRSPSAGKPTGDVEVLLKRERSENNNREIGLYYRKMVSEIKECLANIEDVVPGYEGQGYEIAGMAWFQGWNDLCQRVPGVIKNYPRNLAAMFRDLRKDLNASEMPIAIGEMGVGGHEIARRAEKYGQDDHEAAAIMDFRKAQKAVGDDKSLKNVTFVPTVNFWDDRLQELRRISDAYWDEKQKKGIKDTEENHLPTKELNDEYLSRGGHWYCHYNGSASTYSLIGYALAQALNTGSGLAQATEDILIADFEGNDYGGWKTTGNAFGSRPVNRTQIQHGIRGFKGKGLIDTYVDADGEFNDDNTGTLTSPKFKIERDYITFLIGGGAHDNTCLQLLINEKVVASNSGEDDEKLLQRYFGVAKYKGKTAKLRIVDDEKGGWAHINVDHIVQSNQKPKVPNYLSGQTKEMTLMRQYILFPIQSGSRKARIDVSIDGVNVREFDAEIAVSRDKVSFWAFLDITAFKGKVAILKVNGVTQDGMGMIVQSDEIPGSADFYIEPLRPQFHFSQKIGWNNDGNGMVYYDGEWHLYFQHNPYGWNWGNMHWGHAVSKDLVHWEQLPIAIYNKKRGDWAFSGGGVVDENNTAGWQTGRDKVIVASWTSTGRGECIAYSNDRGRTFTEYEGNPVIQHAGRDPKIVWYEPGKHWVLVVYDHYEDAPYMAFYSSADLKNWQFQSRLKGYYECPELFELPVDGDTQNTRWVVFGADAHYAIGDFDGQTFTPEYEGKHRVHYGNYYASQVFSNAPDGRKIQVGWVQIDMPGMPFNQTFSFPHELALRTTDDGIRMFAEPVKEIEKIYKKKHTARRKELAEGEPVRLDVSGDIFDITATFRLGDAKVLGLDIGGNRIEYHAERGQLQDAPLKPVDGKITIRALIDRPMMEIIGNHGRVYITRPREIKGKVETIEAFASGGKAKLISLEVNELKSIWKKGQAALPSPPTIGSNARIGETYKHYDPVYTQIEDWTIAVDPQLMAAEHEKTRREAFKALANHLQRVKYVVPEDRLSQLQELRFCIELDNPKLSNMQYHPDRGWLIANGHDPRLVKHIHIPHAKELYDPHMWTKHPYVVLHELAHSFHDQVLSFEHPDILGAFEQAKEDGIYEQVLLYTGQQVRHYGLTDHKEYFAEATEAYFGVNDFYPFVRAELKEHDPAVFSLIEKFWGRIEETAQNKYVDLAPTPPMGWNSWNAFEADIDESKIRAIADAMVSSGMRDAGYIYLVLDDGWMAPERDENGRLMADAKKFPNGMKAIGDYIHSKGLKYGIYEDRGVMTCQQLPGSFEHEQIDMETFAEWGVDYIKMDSCFAESNGRMSSEDYGLYRKHLDATGRPIVLSISDFGNAAWVWGGKESSQLWRTSHDIYPFMDSIYACADTSGGDRAIHPAFNGLWQFAGPGHWNDPDMLQVGNLGRHEENREGVADRAHFSLWCILAAPLMAGNNLTKMSKEVKDILNAPELIAVNQDKRGIQGYKVYDDGDCEVYNKPLSDGTTAVLLLNKGEKKADIKVSWEKIGLSGTQPVRDLWARKNLGEFKDSFTARNLGHHEHRMIKVGRPGPPLTGPVPMALDKYTVTRKGETYLSDLYYSWKSGNAPVYDAAVNGGPIRVGGKTFKKGFGCKGKCAVMFKVDGRADRFRAIVAMDKSSKEDAEGRFRVYNEDFFANKVLWDSDEMTKDSPAKEVDIELEDVHCLMLVFDGDDVLGNWADARVISDN